MKTELLKTRIKEFIFSGNDPFVIADDITAFIESNYKVKRDTTNERWLLDTEQWISSWLDLFPVGVKGGSKLLRSDKKICLTKMARFRQDYPEYSGEDIMNATRKYVEEQAERDYAFTIPAVNFISHKEKGSELAARCRAEALYKVMAEDSEISVKPDFTKDYFI